MRDPDPKRAVGSYVHRGHDRDKNRASFGYHRTSHVRIRGHQLFEVPLRCNRRGRREAIGAAQRFGVDRELGGRRGRRAREGGLRDAGDENGGRSDTKRDLAAGVGN